MPARRVIRIVSHRAAVGRFSLPSWGKAKTRIGLAFVASRARAMPGRVPQCRGSMLRARERARRFLEPSGARCPPAHPDMRWPVTTTRAARPCARLYTLLCRSDDGCHDTGDGRRAMPRTFAAHFRLHIGHRFITVAFSPLAREWRHTSLRPRTDYFRRARQYHEAMMM